MRIMYPQFAFTIEVTVTAKKSFHTSNRKPHRNRLASQTITQPATIEEELLAATYADNRTLPGNTSSTQIIKLKPEGDDDGANDELGKWIWRRGT
jgi:hypothetical protein